RAGRFRARHRHDRHSGREAPAGLAAHDRRCQGLANRLPAGLSSGPNWPSKKAGTHKKEREDVMPMVLRRLGVALAALGLSSGVALAQSKVTLAVGGGSCLCYLPTMLAHALGEYEKAGVNVEVVDFKGGSESLKAVIGGSADVVSGYFD